MRTILLLALTLVSIASAKAGGYENTPEEFQAFYRFANDRQGTLVCEVVQGYIYGKGWTTYLSADPNGPNYLLSVYDNNDQRWVYQNLEVVRDLALYRGTSLENDLVRFSSADGFDDLDIGVGRARRMASDLGYANASAAYPYAGGALYQFHNVCMIRP